MAVTTESRAKRVINATDFRGIEDGSGSLTGYIVKFHELNDHGEIYLPGSSKRTSEQFLAEGFNTDSHTWDSVGGNIGFPTDIHEDGDGVLSTFQFHSTPSAQDVRTVAKERMANKLRVGLSIGFNWDENTTTYIYPKDYASELPKLFRSDKLAELMAQARSLPRIRVIRDFTLYEYSVVNSPSQNDANATQVRSQSKHPEIRQKLEANLRTYLGEDIGGTVTMSTLSCLMSCLMYDALYPMLWDKSTPADELGTNMCGAIEEFSQLAQALVPQILSTCEAMEDAGEMDEDDMMDGMARYVLPPNDFTQEGKALGLTLDSHARLALSAAKSIQTRLSALAAMKREKNPELRKGAAISKKRKETLMMHANSAQSIYEGLCSMVNDSDEMPETESTTEYIEGTGDGQMTNSMKLKIQTRFLLDRANKHLSK